MADISHSRNTVIAIPGAKSIQHFRRKLFGKSLSIITLDGKDFFIGVQIATLLHRETFNMYRSMKIKQIDLIRATPDQVEYFVRVGAVRSGTHSVTLVPYEEGLGFILDGLEKQKRSEPNFAKISQLPAVPKPSKPLISQEENTIQSQQERETERNMKVPSLSTLLNPLEELTNEIFKSETRTETKKSLFPTLEPFPNKMGWGKTKWERNEILPPTKEDPLWTLLVMAQEVLV